jgi:hypothetical protein
MVAVTAVLASAAPAQAFYWYGWPGSGLPPPRTIVGGPHTPGTPEFPPVGPPVVPPVVPPGSSVPEPGTGLAWLIGLGVLAARRARRCWRGRA